MIGQGHNLFGLALEYCKRNKAANETTAGCLGLIIKFERKMAEAIEAGQASGEVETPGGRRGNQHVAVVRGPDNGATYERQRLRLTFDHVAAQKPYERVQLCIGQIMRVRYLPHRRSDGR